MLSSRYFTLWGLLITLAGLLSLPSSAWDQNLQRTIMQSRYGDDGVAILGAWQNLIADSSGLTEHKQLEQVNNFFNQNIRYQDDLVSWRKTDYWATPLETLGMRVADCEDYTIAKYVTLIKLGIPIERLRLIYVKAQIGNSDSGRFQAHMVLGYYPSPDAMPLVLDNLVSDIKPATQRTDLRPIFSFNSDGLWLGNRRASQADPGARLSRWRDVLERIDQEGF